MPRFEKRGQDGPRALSFTERVTLFVCAMRKSQAGALLDCFADRPKARALAFAQQVRQWDSSTRQARLTREFGGRTNRFECLQALVVEAPPLLRGALGEQLPEDQRVLFPHLHPTTPVAPAMRALASRLVREVPQ